MRKLFVSEPSLTNFENFSKLAKEVWESGVLTHNGPKVQELERRLKEKWEIPHLSLVTNGTIALEVAIRALDLPPGSEIITTPYTWIATSSSIVWQKYTPIFADIIPDELTIDPDRIVEKITSKTSAILAVHVFSNPCRVEEIEAIARQHKLRVIYDGAHSVNVKYKGRDLSQWGDITTHSYHATKLYNCGEGGSIIASNPDLAKKIERLRFFGHDEKKDIVDVGTNAKMHEISACIGLANLYMMDWSMNHRHLITDLYKTNLRGLPLYFQKLHGTESEYNHSYFPLIFDREEDLLKVLKALEAENIYARRYFYPSMTQYEQFAHQSAPMAEEYAKRSLCLPCHDNVTANDVTYICDLIRETLK